MKKPKTTDPALLELPRVYFAAHRLQFPDAPSDSCKSLAVSVAINQSNPGTTRSTRNPKPNNRLRAPRPVAKDGSGLVAPMVDHA